MKILPGKIVPFCLGPPNRFVLSVFDKDGNPAATRLVRGESTDKPARYQGRQHKMINFRLTTAIFAAAIGTVAVAPQAGADQWDKLTYITISQPVEVPGAVLPPGRYVFKLVDSQSDRHIVTVQNDRQNHTYATILAVPDYRTVPTGKTTFTFWETPAGQPKAVREWFYPGDNFGQEFVYHKKFTQVAQVNQQTETPPPPPAAEAPAPAPPPE